MRICSSCVLPDTFPGIAFDAEGVCNYCREAVPAASAASHAEGLRRQMETAIDGARGRGRYDCIVAFSGGKDSTYTLLQLVERYRLHCLAVTVDNGFISPQARINCDVVTAALGVDLMVFRPAPRFMNTMYAESSRNPDLNAKAAIKRASSICNSCINLINTFMLQTALQQSAPLVAGGYLRGQVPRDAATLTVDAAAMARTRATAVERYVQAFGPEARAHFEVAPQSERATVTIINPMLCEMVTEEHIFDRIAALGWVRTKDTGLNSSNCRLNDLGIAVHFAQYGFNPYVLEIAEQVRNGLMTREEGLKRSAAIPAMNDVAPQAEQIGLDLRRISLRETS